MSSRHSDRSGKSAFPSDNHARTRSSTTPVPLECPGRCLEFWLALPLASVRKRGVPDLGLCPY